MICFSSSGVFFHDGVALPNNSVVLREEIGEGDKALICQTLSDSQCGHRSLLQMFFPNKTEILAEGNGRTMFTTRGDGQILINRRDDDESPLGTYCCQVPDGEGGVQKIFIKVGMVC